MWEAGMTGWGGLCCDIDPHRCHPDESRDPDFERAPCKDFWVPSFDGMTGEGHLRFWFELVELPKQKRENTFEHPLLFAQP